jgi:hypothetical protein
MEALHVPINLFLSKIKEFKYFRVNLLVAEKFTRNDENIKHFTVSLRKLNFKGNSGILPCKKKLKSPWSSGSFNLAFNCSLVNLL